MAKQLYLGGKELILPNARGGQDIKRAYVGGKRLTGQAFPLPASSSGATEETVDGFTVVKWTGAHPNNTGTFTPQSTLEYELFMVGAGGDGKDDAGGGGGGGEVVFGKILLQAGTTYNVQVGSNNQNDPSIFHNVTAYNGGDGGRGGGSSQDGEDGTSGGAGTGGSGGGGGDGGTTSRFGGDSSSTNGILNGFSRYGNDGGLSAGSPNNGDGAGGGGGAVTAGEDGDQTAMPLAYRLGGDGGDGYPNDWLGSTTYYGGGGGGSAGGAGASAGSGGLGGGNGAVGSANAQSAAANTGGGGGGSDSGTFGQGADGIVLIRYRKGA